MIRLTRAVSATIALALLAGCAGDDRPPPPPICPRVGIIDGLQSFDRAATEATGAFGYHASHGERRRCMRPGAGRPRGRDGDRSRRADRAPRVGGRTLDLPYFVAISGPDGAVIDRQDFVGRVSVPAGARRAGVKETFSQRFVGLGAGAAGHQVMFGFALPEDEALRQHQGG